MEIIEILALTFSTYFLVNSWSVLFCFLPHWDMKYLPLNSRILYLLSLELSGLKIGVWCTSDSDCLQKLISVCFGLMNHWNRKKMVTEWSHNGCRMVTDGHGMVTEWSQNGCRMVTEWLQNGHRMVKEWSYNCHRIVTLCLGAET